MLSTPARSTLTGSRNEGDGSTKITTPNGDHDYV